MLMNNGNNMRLIVFIAVVAAVLTMVFATGCTVKHTDATDSIVDSLAYDTTENDTLETLAEETPMPKSADELFDDFIFNFAGSKRVQKQRIHFPLSIVEDGVVKNIGRNDWKFDPFFMHHPNSVDTIKNILANICISKTNLLQNDMPHLRILRSLQFV